MISLLNKFDDGYIMQKKDVLDIIYDYVDKNQLHSFFSEVKFNSDHKYLGFYNTNTHEIVFNDKKIIAKAYSWYDKLYRKYSIDENYYNYFLDFYYLYIIYHELTHVGQTEMYERSKFNGVSLFNYLYELCYSLHLEDNKFYNNKHDIFPMEIDANNNGFLEAYRLMVYTKLPVKEQHIMHLQYLSSLLHNYQKIGHNRIISPIEWLALINKSIDIKRINELLNITKLSKIERFNLGVNVSLNEYNSIVNEKTKYLFKVHK